jgi:ribonuclease PH
MLPAVPLLAEVSDGMVALVIFGIVLVGVIVAVSMGKGK